MTHDSLPALISGGAGVRILLVASLWGDAFAFAAHHPGHERVGWEVHGLRKDRTCLESTAKHLQQQTLLFRIKAEMVDQTKNH